MAFRDWPTIILYIILHILDLKTTYTYLFQHVIADCISNMEMMHPMCMRCSTEQPQKQR